MFINKISKLHDKNPDNLKIGLVLPIVLQQFVIVEKLFHLIDICVITFIHIIHIIVNISLV